MLWSSIFYANNYYVSNRGSNQNDGLSIENAFYSIQQAADLCLSGDTIFIADGKYVGFSILQKNGSKDLPIVFISMDIAVEIMLPGPLKGNGITIEESNYVEISGFNINNMPNSGICVKNAESCYIRNCRSTNNGEYGISVNLSNNILIERNSCANSINGHGIYVANGSDNVILRNNECFGNAVSGIYCNGGTPEGKKGSIHSPQIYSNYIYNNNSSSAIGLEGVINPFVYNNIIANNKNSNGIALVKENSAIVSHGGKIYNNTIVVPQDGKWGVLLHQGANDGTIVYNNIILTEHDRGSIAVSSTENLLCDYNIINSQIKSSDNNANIPLSKWQKNGLGVHSINIASASGLFVNYPTRFDLVDSSAAVNAGIYTANITHDFYGNKRISGGKIDIGAIEFQYESDIQKSFDVKSEKDSVYVIGTLYPTIVTDCLSIKNAQNVSYVQLLTLEGTVFKEYSKFDKMNIKNLKDGVYLVLITYTNGYSQKEIIAKITE